MIKAIVFDFDDTLYKSGPWENWGNYVTTMFKSILTKEQFDELLEKYEITNSTNSIRIAEICKQENYSLKKARKFLQTHYCDNLAKGIPTISNEFLTELSKKYALYVLSLSENYHVTHYADEYKIDLTPFKKVITTSPENGSKLEDLKKIMKRHRATPEQVLMVGDSQKWDLEPAIQLGMQTYYFEGDFNEMYKHFTDQNILNSTKYITKNQTI